MNKTQWKCFCEFREDFKEKVNTWKEQFPELAELQRQAVEKAKAPLYPFETTVVYNKSLDDITESDNIKLIVIGDNPGKDEQLIKNNRYLVGQAGKIAEGYFKRNPDLGVDFRKDVIILNKTPVHSGKTAQLKTIVKSGGAKIGNLIKESQIWMAERTAKLHIDLCKAADIPNNCNNIDYLGAITELWLVGYSELKDKGIFCYYRDYLGNYYKNNCCSNKDLPEDKVLTEEYWNKVFVFQHFSMNRFSIDLNNYINNKGLDVGSLSLSEYIHNLGTRHRKEIFGM